MKDYIKKTAIIIGLLILYIFLVLLETLIFWLAFDEETRTSTKDFVGLFIMVTPLIFVGYIGYRILIKR